MCRRVGSLVLWHMVAQKMRADMTVKTSACCFLNQSINAIVVLTRTENGGHTSSERWLHERDDNDDPSIQIL